MAQIYRDILSPSVGALNSSHRLYRRFDRAWQKYNLNGTEIYQHKLYYYNAHTWIEDRVLKRFLSSIGIKWGEFREQEIDSEIEEAFFFLHPTYEWDGSRTGELAPDCQNASTYVPSTRASTIRVVPTREEIADLFNATFAIGEEVEVSVKYGGNTRRYLNGHSLEWQIDEVTGVIQSGAFNSEYIRTRIESDPWYYLANSRHNDPKKESNQFQLYNPNPLEMPKGDSKFPSNRLLGTTQVKTIAENRLPVDPNEIIGCFAFMDPTSFEKVGTVYNEVRGTSHALRQDGEILSYTYTQKFKFTGMSYDNGFLDNVIKWYEKYDKASVQKRASVLSKDDYKKQYTYFTKDTLYKRALEHMRMYIDEKTGIRTRGVTNSLYYDGFLRTDTAKKMKRRDFAAMIATTIDSGAEAEKASFFEKFLTGIAIVGIIWFAWWLAPAFLSTSGIVWSAVATGAGYAALGLSIYMMALSYFGGLSAQGLVKIVGAFAQVMGYLAVFSGFMAAIKNAGEIAAAKTAGLTAAQAATQAGQEMITQEMLKQTFTDQVSAFLSQSIESGISKVTEFVSAPLMDKVSFIQDGLSVITETYKMYQDKEMEELQDDLRQVEKEVEENEAEMLSNQLKNPSAVYAMTEGGTTYDALNNMSDKIASNIGRDKNFSMWYSNCNSV